ncbi:hypothetical protein [Zobellia nedashkovskayae]
MKKVASIFAVMAMSLGLMTSCESENKEDALYELNSDASTDGDDVQTDRRGSSTDGDDVQTDRRGSSTDGDDVQTDRRGSSTDGDDVQTDRRGS